MARTDSARGCPTCTDSLLHCAQPQLAAVVGLLSCLLREELLLVHLQAQLATTLQHCSQGPCGGPCWQRELQFWRHLVALLYELCLQQQAVVMMRAAE